MKKEAVRARIEEIGIIPAVRVSSAERARYAAEAVYRAGIPIAEITMTVPGALEVIPALLESLPEMVVGAGTVLDLETAERSVNAGAKFLTSTGFIHEVAEFARRKGILVIPGALTPSEIIQAWKAGADFVKTSTGFASGGATAEDVALMRKTVGPDIGVKASGGVRSLADLEKMVAAGATRIGTSSGAAILANAKATESAY